MMDIVSLETAKRLEYAGVRPQAISAGQIWLSSLGDRFVVLKNNGAESLETQNTYYLARINASGEPTALRVRQDDFTMLYWAPTAADLLPRIHALENGKMSDVLGFVKCGNGGAWDILDDDDVRVVTGHINSAEAAAARFLQVNQKD